MPKLSKIEIERDLLIIDVLTLILILVVSISSPTWLRTVFGLPFILFFPGYTLIAALFPRKEGLSGIERLALSFALSLVIVSLIGLIVNYAWSLKLYPILISLSLSILAMSVIAWYKRLHYPASDRFAAPFLYRQNLPNLRWGEVERLNKVLSILLVAVILGAIGTITYVIVTPKEGEKFTEFYLLGSEGKAENYPEELAVGVEEKVILGIVNQEDEPTSYRVEVWIGEEQVNVWLGNVELVEIETGPLSNEEKWEQEVGFESNERCGSTTLSTPVIQGQRTLIVERTDNFDVDDHIQIGSTGEEPAEFVQIEDIDVSKSEITIDKELNYGHNEEEPVIEKKKVEFRLFKNEDSEPYLTLHLYVFVSPA